MKLTMTIIVLLLAFAVARVALFDYDEASDELDRYCQMVGEGSWQDYKQFYKEKCDGMRPRLLHDRRSLDSREP